MCVCVCVRPCRSVCQCSPFLLQINILLVSKLIRMRPQSCKNKGRRFQQKIASSIIDTFPHLTDNDVRSTSMGAQGEDIQMSPLARQSLPLSIECKCVERLNVWQCLEQAASNAQTHTGATPCLVFSRNRSRAYAVLPWDCVLELYKRAPSASSTSDSSSSGSNCVSTSTMVTENDVTLTKQDRCEEQLLSNVDIDEHTAYKIDTDENISSVPHLVIDHRVRQLVLQLYQLVRSR